MLEVDVRLRDGTAAEASVGGHTITLDEPVAAGGADSGPAPHQILLAALGGCTAMTLRLYSRRKGWPLEEVNVKVTLERPEPASGDTTQRFTQVVELHGPLDDAQRERLLQIAGRCPVHRTLEGPVAFEERLVEPAAG